MDRRQWHLERGVSLSHIASTIGIIVVMAGGYANMTARLSVLESQQSQFNRQVVQILEAQSRVDARQDTELNEVKRQIREDYREILQRLDGILRD